MSTVERTRRAWPIARMALLDGFALLALGALAAFAPLSPALAQPVPSTGQVRLAELPREARETYALILRGGPFRYERDGIVFGNRERILPARPRGYYHEYTVATPGVRTRGARRIICGGRPTMPDACYYTDDHYRSFRRIRE